MAAKTSEKTAEKNIEKAADNKAAATRSRELEAAISTITKSYGDGAIMRLGEAHALKKIEVIPTGALAVDLALGVGGLPRGRRASGAGEAAHGGHRQFSHGAPGAKNAELRHRCVAPPRDRMARCLETATHLRSGSYQCHTKFSWQLAHAGRR